MNEPPSLPSWIPAFMRVHAVLMLLFAGGLYVVPSKVFGESARAPADRFAHSLLAATMVALAVAIIGAADGKRREFLQVGLFGALVLDVQIPFLMTVHPDSLGMFSDAFGAAWLLIPLGVIAGLLIPTVFALLETRRVDELS